MHKSGPTDKVADFENLNQDRKPSVSFSLTPSEDQEELNGNCNYDAEAVTTHPKHNFIKKVKSNLSRAIYYLGKGDPHQFCTYGDYPFGDQNTFRDWETW